MQYIDIVPPEKETLTTTERPITKKQQHTTSGKSSPSSRPPPTWNPAEIMWNWVTGKYGIPDTPTPITWYNWPMHINHVNAIHVFLMPILGLYLAKSTPLVWQTALFAAVFLFFTGTGVTAGYHRLWSHRSYTASTPLRIFLAATASTALEGSARYWATEHRAHHRYIDTEKDPYSAKEGFLWSHIGWVVMNRDQGRIHRVGKVDNSDLKDDWVVVWQHRYYWQLALLLAYVFPTALASLWGDPWGGFLYAGLWKIQAANHSIFCVNSLAHWLGDQPFDETHTPRSNFLTALLTFGEGWHNYHHEFPTDYRNGLEWYELDPTKWLIWGYAQLGLASGLKMIKQNEIEKSRAQTLFKKAEAISRQVEWGNPLNQLPVLGWDEFQRLVQDEGRSLVAVEGVIHDVADFINEHPGGQSIIKLGVGKDATAMFNGGVYAHSNAAHNLLDTYRVALLRGGGEVESWKKENLEATGETLEEKIGSDPDHISAPHMTSVLA